MAFGLALRRRAKAAIPPLIFLSLVAYFLWNATQGERGLRAYEKRQVERTEAQAELTRTELELAAWDRRVASLRNTRLDLDALDERVRAMLNLSDPADLIIPYGDVKKQF
jgi:cell division protein FtsB